MSLEDSDRVVGGGAKGGIMEHVSDEIVCYLLYLATAKTSHNKEFSSAYDGSIINTANHLIFCQLLTASLGSIQNFISYSMYQIH